MTVTKTPVNITVLWTIFKLSMFLYNAIIAVNKHQSFDLVNLVN